MRRALLILLLAGCSRAPAYDAKAHRLEVETAHRQRLEKLTAETGFLSLAGLFWLEGGENSVGSAAGNAVRLPKGPPRLGAITLRPDGTMSFQAAEGRTVGVRGGLMTSLPLLHDHHPDGPTVLESGSLRLHVISRSGRLGVRVKDIRHPERLGFEGIARFPVRGEWRLRGVFEAYQPPRAVKVPNVLGGTFDMASPGEVVFRKDGRRFRLQAIGGPDDERLWLIFGDKTNGRESYGAGRFLTIERAGDFVVIDFNKATNPPCAFSPYATCPIPAPGNVLDLAVTAGEKAYHYKKRS